MIVYETTNSSYKLEINCVDDNFTNSQMKLRPSFLNQNGRLQELLLSSLDNDHFLD